MEKVIDVYVTFLSYNPDNNQLAIRNDGFCFLEVIDLEMHRKYKRQQKINSDPDVYKHYRWYNSILKNELLSAPKDSKLRVNQFEIKSGNASAFLLNGDFFPSATIIFTPEMEHWYYWVPGDEFGRMCGSKLLDKNQGMFTKLDIIKLKQQQLRPEPNNNILGVISQAFLNEPFVRSISRPPYFACKYEDGLDCLDDVCKCDNLYKFEQMLCIVESFRCRGLCLQLDKLLVRKSNDTELEKCEIV